MAIENEDVWVPAWVAEAIEHDLAVAEAELRDQELLPDRLRLRGFILPGDEA